jgi:hypothetical protein
VERAQFVGQRPDLRPAFDIAPEQDVASRIGILEEGAFIGGEDKARKAEDGRKHAPPSRISRSLASHPAPASPSLNAILPARGEGNRDAQRRGGGFVLVLPP